MSHHHHTHDSESLSFDEKMLKLLAHWVKHNIDHAKTYREWAERARAAGRPEVGDILERAAQDTLLLNQTFENAGNLIPTEGSGK